MIGNDIKVMALGKKDKILLIVANAISKYVSDFEHYEHIKAELKDFINSVAEEYTNREVSHL